MRYQDKLNMKLNQTGMCLGRSHRRSDSFWEPRVGCQVSNTSFGAAGRELIRRKQDRGLVEGGWRNGPCRAIESYRLGTRRSEMTATASSGLVRRDLQRQTNGHPPTT